MQPPANIVPILLMTKTFGEKAIDFYLNLESPDLPGSLEIRNPYKDYKIQELTKKFFYNFYNDISRRTFIFGINPGRFGGGLTGINFTDPVALRDYCRIENDLGYKKELSSQFIYEFINAAGGTKKFYSKFFLSALYPLAILKGGKNFNYYDDRKVYRLLKPHIILYFKKQIEFGAKSEVVISLGKKNYTYLKEINNELNYFKEVGFLEHPRFIMQYRRKRISEYINKYINLLQNL